MIKLERKTNKILLKELLLRIIYKFHKFYLFKLLFLNKKPKILLNQNYHKRKNDKLVLFSTFNLHGKITENLKFYLKNLYELGSDIVLVDTSPISLESEINSIKPYLNQYIWRENIGYDFGSWKTGLFKTEQWREYNQIILTNDSIYGPLYPLNPIFQKFSSLDIDVWGLTDSFEFEYHLMSYFLVFQNKVINSDAFLKFWQNLNFYPTKLKKLLILEYEVGGTKYWLKNGFKLGSFIDYKILNPNIDTRYFMNPTHVYWDKIIKDYNYPFIKRDLIKALIAERSTDQIELLLKDNRHYNVKYIDLIS
ncbi:hypothetical protein EHQ46_18450 [Leptospira yanagawae]|uniref:Rhamnan synthesis protein F n=1 Tax=Leptospira yanagawae TaxID=293069 RepID=A0ABY2LZU2_9LEPT|nr:rhamnan synthesis F family protein [Leptospira yanagawae]TGL16495.1 hypothetical protein EHQ46_18450 [Leptospira yanagawae]